MFLFTAALYLVLTDVVFSKYIPKIAIVGAGIGGTSCAYFLKQALHNNITITIFEKDAVGGRLATIDMGPDEYESGGSILHPRNRYMAEFLKLLELKKKGPGESSFGIYNGKKFIFRDSKFPIWSMVKLFWRYGWDPIKLQTLVSELLDDFDKIYELQDQGIAFATTAALLQKLNPKFPDLTQHSLRGHLMEGGFSKRFIDEIAQSATVVNYGQSADIGAFAGAVALAGSESGLWSVHGGNKRVPAGLLKLSEAEFIDAEVSSITLLDNNNYDVLFKPVNSEHIKKRQFDAVVIAFPLIEKRTNIQFDKFLKSFESFYKPYHRTVATFVQGTMKASAFSSDSLPDDIILCNDTFMVNSIGQLSSITGEVHKDRPIYKVFSKTPLSKTQVELLFDYTGEYKVKDWLAYPQYTFEGIPPFTMHPNLYYLNAIEHSASAMEMSIISGRNIALLIKNWVNVEILKSLEKEIYDSKKKKKGQADEL